MTTTQSALPRSTPSSRGIPATAIDSLVTALENTAGVEPHSLMLLRGGDVVAEGWWAPYAPDTPHLLYSLSKSFTSTAVAFAIEEGLLGLDDTVVSHFPEFDDVATDERTRSMRVRHLLSMASGHLRDMIEEVLATGDDDYVRAFLGFRPDREPGSVFTYNQLCTFTLGAIVQKLTGETLTEYLTPRLFDRLGITEVGWNKDPMGRDVGWTGLHARTDAVARLGQLYLQKGVWEGEQLIPESWVAEASVSHIDSSGEGNPDWSQGYGYQFWIARHGFRGDGAYGQYCIVLPEVGVVLVMTGQSLDMQAVVDAVWTHLLPTIGTDPADVDPAGTGAATVADDDEAALRERLAHLAMPALRAPADPGSFAGVYAPADSGIPSLLELEVTVSEDRGVSVGLAEADGVLTLPVGDGEWAVHESRAFVASATDQSPRTLLIDVIAVETPHRLHLVLDRDAMVFEARWETPPLQPTLVRDLRMPRV